MAVLILYLCLFCSLSIIRAEVRYMLVEEGAAVEMRVNKTHVNGSYNKWIKGKGSRGQMLRDYGGFIVDPSYIFSCVGSECLRIEKVTVKHADKYEYREMIEGNKLSTEFELLVGKLVCILKIGKQIVGENDCEGVQAEQVSRTCQLTLVGSKKYIPVIKWRAFKNGRQQQADRVVRAVNMTKDASVNVWEVEDSVVVGREDTTFEAYVEGSSFNTFVSAPQDLIMYALNTTKPTSRMTYSNKHTRMCKAIKSSHVQCRYKWVLYHTDQQQRQTRTEFEGAKLRGEDIEKEGKYECHASCRLDTHPCTILADSFFLTGSQQSFTYLFIIISIILVLSILAAAFLLMLYLRKSRKYQVVKNTYDNLLTIKVITTPITALTTTATTSKTTTATTSTTTTSPPLLQNRQDLIPFERSSSNESLLITKIADQMMCGDDDGWVGIARTELAELTKRQAELIKAKEELIEKLRMRREERLVENKV